MNKSDKLPCPNVCYGGYCLFFDSPRATKHCFRRQDREWDGSCTWRLDAYAVIREIKDDIVYFSCCPTGCARDLKGLAQWDGECNRP